MGYAKHYSQLLMKHGSVEKPSTYSEKHHIVPKCLGGDDSPRNLIHLSAEAHYVAHQLLVKMNPGHYGIAYAAMLMTRKGNGRGNGRAGNKQYSWLKRRFSELNSLRVSQFMSENNPSKTKAVKEIRRKQLIENNPAKRDDVKKKISEKAGEATRLRMKNDEAKAAWVDKVTRAKVEQNSYAKQASSLSARWADPEFKARQIALIKEGKAKKKIAESCRKAALKRIGDSK